LSVLSSIVVSAGGVAHGDRSAAFVLREAIVAGALVERYHRGLIAFR
jgi:hypothetical protein